MKKIKSKFSGSWLVFLGVLLWSINPPLIKIIEIDPMLVCAIRAGIAGLVLAPFIRLQLIKWNGWILLFVLSYTSLSLAILTALKMTSATIAIGMQYTSPVWLFVFALLLHKERFRWKSFLPIALIFMGVLIFIMSGTNKSDNIGNLIALTEGISFALMTVSGKKAGGSNTLGVVAIANLASAPLIFAFLPPSIGDLFTIPAAQWYILLLIGVVQTGGGYAFYNLGLRTVSPQKASIINLWEIILGSTWVAIFLHEYPNTAALSGMIVIFIGLFFNSYLQGEETAKQKRIYMPKTLLGRSGK